MKVEDYSRKIADLQKESRQNLQEMKKDQEDNLNVKKERLAGKVAKQEADHQDEITRLTDRFDSQVKKMSDSVRQRHQEEQARSKNEIEEERARFLKEGQVQRKEFQDRTQGLSAQYARDLEEKDKKGFIQGQKKDENYRQFVLNKEADHAGQLESMAKASDGIIKKQQAQFTRDKMEMAEQQKDYNERVFNEHEVNKKNLLSKHSKDLSDGQLAFSEREVKTDNNNRIKYGQQQVAKQEEIDNLLSEHDQKVKEVEEKFNRDRQVILEEANLKHAQHLDQLQSGFNKRSMLSENVYKEGIQLKDIENKNIKNSFEEKRKLSQKQYQDEIDKNARYSDIKIEMERSNMKKELAIREDNFKERVNQMRLQFNKEVSNLRERNASEVSELTNRYEERLRAKDEEVARSQERSNVIHRQEIENLAMNSKREKEDLIAHYEDRIKDIKKANSAEALNQSQKVPKQEKRLTSNQGLS